MLGTMASYHYFSTENSTTACYDHFAPQKYQHVVALCLQS